MYNKFFKFSFILSLFILMNLSAESFRYSKVELRPADKNQLLQLAKEGINLDDMVIDSKTKGMPVFRGILNNLEIGLLKQSGINFEILIEDVVRAYQLRDKLTFQERQTIDATTSVDGFEFGSMGGFYTFDEVIAELDSMFLLYPDLVTERVSLGQSHENRELWMVKISVDPNEDQDEPEVLYTGLHHAREPQGMMCIIYFMYYLLENYGTDTEVTYLLENRELFFVPVVNPDGYVYNELNNPEGGGQWRKNRRDNGSNYGVDLNRNYGYEWGYDNVGSSPLSWSDTYRGPGPFSEPETQAIRDFCELRHFAMAFNYHTYSNVLIYPWGYAESLLTPDSLLYMEYGMKLTETNTYAYGTGNETINYVVNGDSDDWMYGEQNTKSKILAMTPEVGSDEDGFWPDESRIYPLAEENLQANLDLAWFGGGRVDFIDYEIFDLGDENGYPDPGETIQMVVRGLNRGQGVAEEVIADLTEQDDYLIIKDRDLTPKAVPSRSFVVSDTFEITISADAPVGHIATLFVDLFQRDYFRTFSIEDLVIGTPGILFSDDAESGMSNWTTNDSWGVDQTNPFEGNNSFSDSPGTDYDNSVDHHQVLSDPILLPDAQGLYLEFWTRWRIESYYDGGRVEVSVDGSSWTPVSGQLSGNGAGKGVQPSGEPCYDGYRFEWVREWINLTDWLDETQLYFRFRFQSDGGRVMDGWFVDNIRLLVYDEGVSNISVEKTKPRQFKLDQNYPNPFNPETSIRFELPDKEQVDVSIYNLQGEKVKTLINSSLNAGEHLLSWNGINESGRGVSSGMYIIRFSAGSFTASRKILLLR